MNYMEKNCEFQHDIPESCEVCASNRGFTGAGQFPCGQQNCWYGCTVCIYNSIDNIPPCEQKNKIHSDYLGLIYDKNQLEKQFGTVEYQGKKIWLIQQAYLINRTTYEATAIDQDGETYSVTWNTIEGWEDHVVGENGECVVEDCNGFCEDESNACDWDKYTVTKN